MVYKWSKIYGIVIANLISRNFSKKKGINIMNDITIVIEYVLWIIIIGLTLVFFSYFSKKYKKVGSLMFFVLFPTWIIVAIIKGIEYKYFDLACESSLVLDFSMLLGRTLPSVLLFGGTTFIIKYLRLWKKNRKNDNEK